MAQPFSIHIDKAVLADLRQRIAATRWPDQIEGANWDYGTNEPYLKELCTYWASAFDWTKQETYLNSFQHFKTTIDESGLHFIHHQGQGKTSIPILLIHGYPDSFVRFLTIIPLLTQADEQGFSFDVVVPSIPGYGFSDRPTEPGMKPEKIASLFADLMDELGYPKFVAHGGDWGGSITENLGLYHADSLLGIHLTDVPSQHALMPVDDPTAAEKKYLQQRQEWMQTEGGYFQIQSTKPQTLAYGLMDSPVGLAGWIVEKFKSWSDNDGEVEDAFTKDELLTNITLYWVTQTIHSAIRIYYEARQALQQSQHNPLMKLNPFDKTGDKSTVPAAFALFPKDISSPPREFAERFFTISRWTKLARGGHFTAMEEPELLANDIREFVRSLRQSGRTTITL
jgi:pimeloyl-ACP methyl ester carboxylesterase